MKEILFSLIDRACDVFIKCSDKVFLWFWKKFLPREMAEEMAFLTGLYGVFLVACTITVYLGMRAIVQKMLGIIGMGECMAVAIFAIVTLVFLIRATIEAMLYHHNELDGFKHLLAEVRYRSTLWRRG